MSERAWDQGYEVGYDDAIFNQRGISTDRDADEYPHDNPYRNRDRSDIDATALRATISHHLPKDRWDENGDLLGTFCSAGDWQGDYFADGEAGPFDAHLAEVIADSLAPLLDRLVAAEGAVGRVRKMSATVAAARDSGRYDECVTGWLDAIARDIVDALDGETR